MCVQGKSRGNPGRKKSGITIWRQLNERPKGIYMSRKMLINATHPEEHRVAIVEDGNLAELDIEITGKEQTRGNIYKGTVVRVETGLQAAFVDFGSERPGFLQIGEIQPSFYKNSQNGENKGRPRINDLLRRGQELLVQVVKEERGTKGAALTTYLSLPGRFMVLMPDSDTKGVSRKIEQESQRKKLKETMASLELPVNIGYIVRTAGIGQKKAELKRDVDYLIRVYEKILDLGRKVKAPSLIYKESNLVIRSIRDYFSSDIDEVLVDDPDVAREAKEFFEMVMPEYAKLVKQHQERRPIFSRYQIEEQIESLTRNKVALPSGGSIVIDSTEALVAVDVNSGKLATEQGVEATAFKSNMEAAVEVARQLRLRDLGGLIVIDFIDMRDRKHVREVEKCLKEALKADKARVTVGRISQFGLLEMSRQRIKSVLAAAAYLSCPHCEGTGKIKSSEAQALDFLRRIYAGMAKGHIGLVEAEIPLDVASYLLNQKRAELLELERHYSAVIEIKGRPDFISGQMEISFLKREKEHQVTTQQYIDAAAGRSQGAEQAEAVSPEPEPTEKSAESATGKEEGSRKRRRPRRRRKSAAEETEKTAASGDSSTPQPLPANADTAMRSTPGEDLLELMRSGRSGRPAEKTPTAAVAAPSAVSSTEEPPVPADEEKKAQDQLTPPASAPSEMEKPSRKPRRRRKPAAAAKQVASEPGSAEITSAPSADQKPAETLPAPEAKEEQPKPQRKPRRRGKAAATPKAGEKEQNAPSRSDAPTEEGKTPSTPTAPAMEGTADASSSETETKAEPKPARARRPRRTTRAKKAGSEATAAKTEESSEAKEQKSPENPQPESEKKPAAEKKPARRPRTRKPAAAKTADTATEKPAEKNAEN
jgi:ribonuclease E